MQTASCKTDSVAKMTFLATIVCLVLTVTCQCYPSDSVTNLPSMLAINSEEELGLYSKKWNLTPVQMCTLMGHQMTVAQPLLDINHPMVAHLPTIGEMAMSDAVFICEKVLNDAKGGVATITTVVEETRQEFSVPSEFMFDDDLEDMAEEMMEAVGFTDDEMREAMAENEGVLIDLLDAQEVVTEPPVPVVKTPKPSLAESLGRVY